MDMDKASKHTDGYGWIAIKSIWIWMDMDKASLMDWIGLGGFPYVAAMRIAHVFSSLSKVVSFYTMGIFLLF